MLLGVLCKRRVLALLVFPLMSAGLGSRRCAYRWTRPLGVGWRGHSLCDLRGVFWFAQKCAVFFQGDGSDPICMVPYMLALVGQPSLHGYHACMVFWAKGCNSGEIACKIYVRPLFLVFEFFCVVETKLFFLVEKYTCLVSVAW